MCNVVNFVHVVGGKELIISCVGHCNSSESRLGHADKRSDSGKWLNWMKRCVNVLPIFLNADKRRLPVSSSDKPGRIKHGK